MIIAQFTDLHLIDPHHNLASAAVSEDRLGRAMDLLSVMSPRPEVLIITGDIAESGTTNEYQILANSLPQDLKVYVIPGNHDCKANMYEVLSPHMPLDHKSVCCFTVEFPELLLIALDSTVDKKSYGFLTDDTLHFLERKLRKSTKPALIALHHPPVSIGVPEIDKINLRNAIALWPIIDSKMVSGIICGHVHKFTTQEFASVSVVTGPSIAPGLASCQQWPTAPAFLIHELEVGRVLKSRCVHVC